MAEAVPKLSKKERERAEAVNELREILKPGDTVYTKLNHVSRSGMTRSIEVMVFRDNAPINLTYVVSEVLDYKIDNKHWGLKVGGCGMDMGFHVVYELGSALWPKGTRKPHGTLNGHPDSEGGYALKHQWI